MQLYLANKDTEFILFRPIRNNVLGAFVKLEQILMSNCYTKDDLTICGCPSADQVSVLLSNASLVADSQQQSTLTRKISTSSTEGATGPLQRKISIDRMPSIDGSQIGVAPMGTHDTLIEVKEVSSPEESPNRIVQVDEAAVSPESTPTVVMEIPGAGISNV